MSYIVPRDIPKNCFECPCCTLGYCRVDVKTTEYAKYVFSDGQDGRYPDCPLIEIPTPHGRLKDVDRIEYENVYFEDVGESYEIVGKDDIDELPTVIEAEGSEE